MRKHTGITKCRVRQGEEVVCKIAKKWRDGMYMVTVLSKQLDGLLVTFSSQDYRVGQEITARVALQNYSPIVLVDPSDFGVAPQLTAEVVSLCAYRARTRV